MQNKIWILVVIFGVLAGFCVGRLVERAETQQKEIAAMRDIIKSEIEIANAKKYKIE